MHAIWHSKVVICVLFLGMSNQPLFHPKTNSFPLELLVKLVAGSDLPPSPSATISLCSVMRTARLPMDPTSTPKVASVSSWETLTACARAAMGVLQSARESCAGSTHGEGDARWKDTQVTLTKCLLKFIL